MTEKTLEDSLEIKKPVYILAQKIGTTDYRIVSYDNKVVHDLDKILDEDSEIRKAMKSLKETEYFFVLAPKEQLGMYKIQEGSLDLEWLVAVNKE